MGVDDDIRGDTLTSEWHVLWNKIESSDPALNGHTYIHTYIHTMSIANLYSNTVYLLSVCDSTGTLLSVTTGKLVPDLRHSYRANPDLTELVPILIHG